MTGSCCTYFLAGDICDVAGATLPWQPPSGGPVYGALPGDRSSPAGTHEDLHQSVHNL